MNKKIAYLGPEATFSHLAAREIYKRETVEFEAAETIEDVFELVHERKCLAGVVPIENSNAGSVAVTLDIFANEDYNLSIIGEYYQKIDFCFLSKSKDLKKIKVIYAQQMAHAQCRKWLKNNFPGIIIEKVSSNSLAAQKAAEDKKSGAISNEIVAGRNSISIHHNKIQDYPNNSTRFVVISRETELVPDRDKASLFFSVKHEPGSLFSALESLNHKKVNMTKIESRIMKFGNWQYYFFVDIEGDVDEENIKEALADMKEHCLTFKIIGNYKKAELPGELRK